jgi:glycerol-3-phosphate acyltransferase PlsY
MTTASTALLTLTAFAYLLGSIPFGLLVAKTRGIDPRKAGSGNIGATNVGRLLGKKFFAIVFILDLLKGLLPTLAAAALLTHFRGNSATYSAFDYLLWLLVAFAAICGHMFSVFLKFKGGKGVATSAGVILGVFPYFTAAAIAAILIFLLTLKTTRYMSVASMAGSCALPLAYIAIALARRWPLFHQQLPLLIFAILIAAMIVYKHRGNIARLRAGTESRYARKSTPQTSSTPKG